MYKNKSRVVAKFDLSSSVVDAVAGALRAAGFDPDEILSEALVTVLIVRPDGNVNLGLDKRGGEITPAKQADIEKKGLIPNSLNTAAFFIGEGCRVIWINIDGDLTQLKIPCPN